MSSSADELIPRVTQRRRSRSSRIGSLPTAGGGIARAAYAAAKKVRLDLRALLRSSDLTLSQAEQHEVRISVKSQIKFLNEVASALPDDLLDVMAQEEQWMANLDKRAPRGRDELARLIDASVLKEALEP